jgi:hypothetical protein
VVNFKYEKLGTFCFVYGVLGHTKNKCEVRLSNSNGDVQRRWYNGLQVEQYNGSLGVMGNHNG